MKVNVESRFYLLCVLFIGILPSAFCDGGGDLVQFAVAGMEDSLSKIDRIDVSYCVIGANLALDQFNVPYLKVASYDNVVANMGIPRSSENPLLNYPIKRYSYREAEDREFLELFVEIPESAQISRDYTRHAMLSADCANEVSKRYSVSQDGEQEEVGFIGHLDSYFHDRQAYTDPGILFSHTFFSKYRYDYVDMINREGAVADQDESKITIKSLFAFAGDAGIVDVVDREDESTQYCQMEISTSNFLPSRIEFGPVHSFFARRLEVERYFERNGAWYPERGRVSSLENGIVINIEYYVVDHAHAQLNTSLSDGQLSITFPPGTSVYDSLLDVAFKAE